MSTSIRWYAVYTHPRWEKKVAERLTRNKIEAYCPLNKVYKEWADRKKIIYEPLFTSYVFVHIAEMERNSVKETNGIINFVHWLGKPAVIKDEEIEVIKNFLPQCKNIKLEKVNVNINDCVNITNGAYISKEGNIIEVQPKTVKVNLPSLGYKMIAEFEKSSIELINGLTAEHRLVS